MKGMRSQVISSPSRPRGGGGGGGDFSQGETSVTQVFEEQDYGMEMRNELILVMNIL